MAIEFYGAAPSEAFAGGDLVSDALEESWAGMRICVNKDEPIAGSGGSAGVSGASDLVDRFEDDCGTRGARDFSSLISGIIIADDKFGLPAALMKGGQGSGDLAKSFAKALFLVEGGDDDRDFQAIVRGSMPESRPGCK